MTTLQTYAVSIFQMLEAPIDKYYATLILGVLQIVGSGGCVLMVHYTGKRPLTFFSTAGAAVCCLLVAGYDVYIQKNILPRADNSTLGTEVTMNNPNSWIPTTLLMLLALITHTGIRLLPWLLIGEVFGAQTRSGGAGLTSAVGYIFGFLTNKLYIGMVDSLSIWGTYGFYGIISLTGCFVFYFILPETEGKKLNDIEKHFAGVKRLTNTVYRSLKRNDISKLQDLKGATNPSFEADTTYI
ncbi:facilitated trehalose transporter Tret1-like [Pieris rapae]|uniref:facilitated trehalose transporter Tret1-like n=1 Tax=Pieris rapae TaxID=64459 RepID=UPI001E2819E0|nr:facilitated trehalose transporter Tret1-like [Pieris rapae]